MLLCRKKKIKIQFLCRPFGFRKFQNRTETTEGCNGGVRVRYALYRSLQTTTWNDNILSILSPIKVSWNVSKYREGIESFPTALGVFLGYVIETKHKQILR